MTAPVAPFSMTMKTSAIKLLAGLLLASTGLAGVVGGARPNIIMIVSDDLNNWVGYFAKHTKKGHPQSMTPNIDRLSAMGVSFTNAHASSTICNPSRAAVWSGVRPETSGCYTNKDYPWTSYIKKGIGLNAYFKKNGYYVAASGKTYHSSQGGFDAPEKIYVDEWDEYPNIIEGWDRKPAGREGFTEPVVNASAIRDEDNPDWHTISFCIDSMLKDSEYRDGKPLFLACGLKKPHLPWAVPSRYYDLFPRDDVILPPYPSTNDWKDWNRAIMKDLKDLPEYAIDKFSNPHKEYTEIIEKDRWEDSIQAYLATITYMDMNVGRLLDALEEFSERDNTIIQFWSDHGYNLGEKGHHKKQTLWEESSDVPFIWVVPGVTKPGTICNSPVDLQSIYPTLCDLAGLAVPDHVDGDNIRPLLENPQAKWNGVAKITMKYGNHAVVNSRFRYIRYVDGSEELYNHTKDPNEFDNVAKDREYDEIKKRLIKWLPRVDMPLWHDGSMNHAVNITCNYEVITVKKCSDGKNFVARDPNRKCRFVRCPS